MTDTPAISGAAPPLPSNAPAAASAGDKRLLSSDFETFLRMLTAQAENQDPLNPLDSTDFAVQLATFSSVEQQVLTNDLLSQMRASGLAQVSSWVGMEARAAVPVRFDGTPIALETAPNSAAARAELVVRDADGREWDRFDIATDGGEVTWSGRRDDGTLFEPGTYAFEITSYDATGEEISQSTPQAYGRVTEARQGADGPVIVFAGGTSVPAAEISALRAPDD